jgi:hypothetical protein
VKELLEGERIVGRTDVRAVLRDQEEGCPPREQIFSEYTRCSILFLPRESAVAIAFRGEDGLPGEYRTVTLETAEP